MLIYASSSKSHARRARGARAARALGLLVAALAAAVPVAASAASPPAAAPTSTALATPGTQGPPAATSAPLLPLTPARILAHVRRTISWYRELGAVGQLRLPGVDTEARQQLEQQGLTAVRLALRFGFAAAAVLTRAPPATPGGAAAPTPTGSPTIATQLAQAATSLAARRATLVSEIAALDADLRRVRVRQARLALLSRRADLAAALALIDQIQSNIGRMRSFQASAIAGAHRPPGLQGQLVDLENSLPELKSSGPTPTGTPRAAASGAAAGARPTAPAGFRPASAGIAALIGQWFALHESGGQLAAALAKTNSLEIEVQDLRTEVLGRVRKRIGGVLAAIGSASATALAGQRTRIEAATGELKELSTVLVPLGDEALTLASAHGVLAGWSAAVSSEQSTVESYLGLRVGFVLALIAAVLVVSEIWRRATFRYLQDARRRRPFLVLRRMVIGLALTLIVIFGLVSQVGSVATYAGFVTAGLAIALQNVVLAVVAYFFLIGRYGVRVGDRITIASVTGRVVDISLLRLYLLELSGPEMRPTGRMVVLSNAVLFQPSALFKQIPGADYFWHSVTLTIPATADADEAHRRLQAAAREVYATYRSTIDKQHAQTHRFIEFETTAPEPEVRMRLTDNGLECEVRYPVLSPEKSARIDQQMLAALRAALERDQQFQLVASGGVTLKSDL
jgi:small-conductance mechanosensitive channel